MKKNLLLSLAVVGLISSVCSPLVAYADQPGDTTDTTILQEVKDGCSGKISLPAQEVKNVYNGKIFLYDAVKRNGDIVTFYVQLGGNILSVSGSDGTNFSFDITARSSYVGYNFTTSGDSVKAAQILLDIYHARTGEGTSVAVDSLFGPSSHSALQTFQVKNNLSTDCVVGPNTWRKLCSYL